ncbi:deoxynucleotidyltransferase terminal-interacting protein 2 [Cheilinus undulatus]|uniref:deoxynucleotidyltransferase terminal-interacting protein 2 n=1 Tax=Cheilinus undulatus TaxID=241271 RepID=UPI001BD2B476|nr:deoxynucleotidyltransferase terminal-interacting protein 2 [Cheilinus undulatus]
MVATRRGARAGSPSKNNPDMHSDVQATPSIGRRTRRTAKQAESPTHDALVETSRQLEKSVGEAQASPPASLMKRCTRASRLHSPEQPCTPVGSIHEADHSDVESCCSAVSDAELPMTHKRQRRTAPRTGSQEEETSEMGSVRRSTRKRPAKTDQKDAKAEVVQESESCSSVVSESRRATRSQRKTRSRSSTKQQTVDSEVSDAESCTSSVSSVSKSTRSRRSRRQTGPIPIHLEEEASESSCSPARRTPRTRAPRGKASDNIDVSEPPSCDSEGFESGPTYSRTTRRRGKPGSKADSDSEPADGHSPLGSRGTPCSSRTGSGSSSLGAHASKSSIKDLNIIPEKAAEQVEEEEEKDASLSDSRLDSTIIAEDADCTLLEEDKSQTEETEENAIPEEDSLVSEDTVGKPAVTMGLQQEEPCAESKLEDASQMETMQQTETPSEQLEPSVTETQCERIPEITEEAEHKDKAADVDTHSSQADEAVDEVVVVETRPSEEEEEKMEVSMLNRDDQQVVDSCEVESVQVTSSEEHKITVESSPEQPKDVIVQKTKTISLLESSEDEEESAEEEEDVELSEEEDLENRSEERGGPSKSSRSAGSSVEGLFMIDTRPGQHADEHYYKERLKVEEEKETGTHEQDEEDEEFVDEEGSDDGDEDAMILFSSRNSQMKELSSRIDPGIRLKELGGLYINFDGSKSKPVSGSLQKQKEKKIQDEVMKKSVIGPDFEKKEAVPPYSESKQALKLKHKVEREKSTGDGWFNMKAPEITQELKGDLQVLQKRGSVDPKRFYKKNDRDGFPKYFQIGTVVDSPVDFYHSRIPKKDRKRTMVEELMADAEFRHNNKKKYQNIVAEKAAQGAGRRHKKNKFHKKMNVKP